MTAQNVPEIYGFPPRDTASELLAPHAIHAVLYLIYHKMVNKKRPFFV